MYIASFHYSIVFVTFVHFFLNEDGLYNENCSVATPCDSSKHLECLTNRCLCMDSHYHRNESCYDSMYICEQSLSNLKISIFILSRLAKREDSLLSCASDFLRITVFVSICTIN